jgi:hypothetical protein
MKQKIAIVISGLLWIAAGASLLYRGLQLLSATRDPQKGTLLMALALVIGFLKGRYVLSKSAARISKHILSLPLPFRWTNIYPKSYWLLLSSMFFFAFLLRFVPVEWRGTIDVAIGFALLQGAGHYFKAARQFQPL